MRSPLDIILSSDTGWPEMHIGGRIRDDYQQTTSSPGGYATITYSLREPILADTLLNYGTVSAYDKRSAEQVHGGRLVIPGKSTDASGDTWQIQAIGEGPAHMQDFTVPLAYVDSQLQDWTTSARSSTAGQVDVSSTPDGIIDDAIVLSAPGGSVVANGLYARVDFELLDDCGMTLGGYGFSRRAGKADTGWQNESATRIAAGTVTTVSSANWTASTVAAGPFVVVTDFPSGDSILRLNIRRSGGAGNVGDDTSWGSFSSVWVRSRLLNADGTNVANASHANPYVLASDVVSDLLGRLLTRFDGAGATVSTTTHHIDQLAFADGATPQQVVEELLKYETDHTWHVWGLTSSGLHEFEFVPWGTTVRYDVSVVDGFDSPAPTDDLYNEVNVRYKDLRGRVKWTTRTQTVDALGSRTQSAMLDLSDEEGSLANANRAGDQFLAQHATPPNQGTLRIARPVMDNVAGRMVQPWEVRPGSLFRVRGVRPYVDSLNATDRDGVTVFRGVSTSFSDSDGACTVELDNAVDDETQAITRLVKKRRRKR